jgi:hypothetical protein
MSRQFLTSLNLNKNELLNARIQNLATPPSSPVTGQVYYDTTLGALRQYNGAAWKTYTKSGDIVNDDISSTAAIALSKLATDPLARANHTGTQLASTISDFNTAVHTNRLDQMAAPTADVSLNSHKITNLAAPTTGTDAANKQYVDDAVAGLTWKASVNLLAHTNVPLTGSTETLVIDGHAALDQTDSGLYRLLLVGQSTASQNGIYLYTDNGTAYTLTRPTDADTPAELIGASVFVTEGTAYGTSSWVQSNHYLSSFSNQVWVQFNGAAQITAGDGLTKDGNTLAVGGTTDRITVGVDSVDIASTYVGQTSITTVGTVTTGTWDATTIAITAGGTGAENAADARTNLGATTKYTVNNPLLTPTSGAVAWEITHTVGNADVIVQLREVASGQTVEVDVTIVDADTVILSWIAGANVTADTYRVVIVG